MLGDDKNSATRASDRMLIDANVDYGSRAGSFVRVDFEIPAHGLWDRAEGSRQAGYLCLEPHEAEELAQIDHG